MNQTTYCSGSAACRVDPSLPGRFCAPIKYIAKYNQSGAFPALSEGEEGFCACFYPSTLESGCQEATLEYYVLYPLYLLNAFISLYYCIIGIKFVYNMKQHRLLDLRKAKYRTLLTCPISDLLNVCISCLWISELIAKTSWRWLPVLDSISKGYYFSLAMIVVGITDQITSFVLNSIPMPLPVTFFLRCLELTSLLCAVGFIVLPTLLRVLWIIFPVAIALLLVTDTYLIFHKLGISVTDESTTKLARYLQDLHSLLKYSTLYVFIIFLFTVSSWIIPISFLEFGPAAQLGWHTLTIFSRVACILGKQVIYEFSRRQCEKTLVEKKPQNDTINSIQSTQLTVANRNPASVLPSRVGVSHDSLHCR